MAKFSDNLDYYYERTSFYYVEPKAALIDMDGVLYDSMPRHAAAWKRLTEEIGIELPEEEFYLHEGRTGADTINRLFKKQFGREATEKEQQELYHRKTLYFQELPEPKPMPGAAKMLQTLKEHGVERVLVTGSGQSSLLQRIEKDFPGAFRPEMRITSNDVGSRGKPDAYPYALAMQKAGVLPYQAFVVENAPLGTLSGRAAYAFTIGVTTGPIKADILYENGAHLVFPSMMDLADNLPDLLETFRTYRNLNS